MCVGERCSRGQDTGVKALCIAHVMARFFFSDCLTRKMFFLISRNDSELYTWNMSNMSIYSVLEFEENNLRSLGAAKCCILTNLSDFSKQEYFRFWTIWLLSFHIFRQSLRVSSYGLSNFKPGHSCGIFLLSRTKVLVILHQPGFFLLVIVTKLLYIVYHI